TAVAAGHGPGWAMICKPEDVANLTLKLAKDDVPITGRVVDLEGNPIQGATVRVMLVIPMVKEDLKPWLDAFQEEKREYKAKLYRGAELYPEVAGLAKP